MTRISVYDCLKKVSSKNAPEAENIKKDLELGNLIKSEIVCLVLDEEMKET